MKRVCFSGETAFLQRHALLIEAVARRGFDVSTVDLGKRPANASLRYATTAARFAVRLATYATSANARKAARDVRAAFYRSPEAFVSKSREFESRIEALPAKPAVIVHLFAFSSPFAGPPAIPYVHYLDDTRALARRHVAAGAALEADEDPDDVERFMALERRSFERAARLFATSDFVRRSIERDYGIAAESVEVVGAAPTIAVADAIPKLFGTRRLLFDAGDFARRDGDLAVATFDVLRRADPTITLVTVGDALPAAYAGRDGIDEHGDVSPDVMRELYTTCDLVLAPAPGGPLSHVAVEAMAHGTPAVVRDRDGMTEIVTNGRDGIVIRDDDARPDRLAAIVRGLLADRTRRQTLSDGARSTVGSRLNVNTVAEKMEPFLRAAGSLGAQPA